MPHPSVVLLGRKGWPGRAWAWSGVLLGGVLGSECPHRGVLRPLGKKMMVMMMMMMMLMMLFLMMMPMIIFRSRPEGTWMDCYNYDELN